MVAVAVLRPVLIPVSTLPHGLGKRGPTLRDGDTSKGWLTGEGYSWVVEDASQRDRERMCNCKFLFCFCF